jgi:splicing factor 3B subunit 4
LVRIIFITTLGRFIANVIHREQDKEATVYVGNIDERVTDSLIWELMLQAGRIVNVHLPKDRVTQSHQGYGFVEFISEEDAEYAARIMNQVRLYGKPIRVNKVCFPVALSSPVATTPQLSTHQQANNPQASADKQKTVEVGADLFIGNLDPLVDEKTLYDTFSRFGSLISAPKIARDPENGLSKNYGFVSYSNFEASDDAIANMNGQYLMNKDISVQYAYKKDGKGERHGDPAERMLAAQAKAHGVVPEHQAIPPQLLGLPGTTIPQGPAAMGMGMGMMPEGAAMRVAPPPTLPDGFGRPPATYQNVPPPQRVNAPLPPPPQGLPQRPPPSQAGYGGPQDFRPQGFAQQQPQGFAQQMPPGFAPPPPPPGGMPPPGFMQPPGFQQQQGPPGYRR